MSGTDKNKVRVDSARNRERLLAAAKLAFKDVGANASLNEIAQLAGVGIATLYRHFSTREALIEEVYRREVEYLIMRASELLETSSAVDALQSWLKLSVDYIATKKIITPAITSTPIYGTAGAKIADALFLLVNRALEAQEIRSDVTPSDVLRALVGFTYGHEGADWQVSASRLIDVLVAGLRT